MKHHIVRIVAALALGGLVCSCGLIPKNLPKLKSARAPVRSVSFVDLPRFMGDWRVIASIPRRGEKGRVDEIQSFALRPDGRIESWLTFRRKNFEAPQRTERSQITVVNAETNAEWAVRSLALPDARLFIIALDPAYQWAVIGQKSRGYGVVLARERTLPAETLDAILDRVAVQGYDPARFEKIPQLPWHVTGD
jgi:apolipoprotein D and lipocalin family protein